MNLVPSRSCPTPNYWCTWASQNIDCQEGLGVSETPKAPLFPGDQGAKNGRIWLNEKIVFGKGGWVHKWPEVRGELFFLLDDGWDVSYETHPDKNLHLFGSLELDETRFPSCAGTPAERLRKLNAMLKEAGWKGAGLWIAAQAVGDGLDGKLMDDTSLERYWRERLRWCHEAGIGYWKVDWGRRFNDVAFCRMLTDLAKECAPGLIVEHAVYSGGLNDLSVDAASGVASGSGRALDDGPFAKRTREILDFAGVIRLYDTFRPLVTVTMLDRIACALRLAAGNPDASSILNVEDSLYLGAALGASLGVMRAPHKVVDPYDGAERCGSRMREVVRSVRWQRLAPAFAANLGEFRQSDEILFDSWTFAEGETWWPAAIGPCLKQGAPACVTRGLPLPELRARESLKPFVVASKNPSSGAVAIATLPRLFPEEKRKATPLADVSLSCEFVGRPVGVFGRFGSLTLDNGSPLPSGRVFAQDLASDEAMDISAEVERSGSKLILPGALIERVGTMAQNATDVSAPGLLVVCGV